MSLYPELTIRSTVMRQLIRLLVLGTIIVTLMYPGGAAAQTNSRFFPETGRTVGGRFLDYWQSNGGLPVFGYPLSDQIQENGRSVQYFERQRFELHPENAPPYDVLLGRLGAELLARSGGNPPIGSGTPAGCVRFDLTHHTVCNQSGNTGFLFLKEQHMHPLRMVFHFEQAFGFTNSVVGSIAYWGISRSDENINLIIETCFAEKRVRGYLRIDRIAAHLRITPAHLRSLLEQSEYRMRISSLTWNTGTELRTELMIKPDLLIDLEQRFPDPTRPPWWFWQNDAKNEDAI
jgi:hypothetical protein